MSGHVAVAMGSPARPFVKTSERLVPVVERRGGVFVLHLSVDGPYSPKWTLTHEPTGFAAVSGKSRREMLEAARLLLALPIDWSFTDPVEGVRAQRLSKRTKLALKKIRQRWPS